MAEFLLLCLWLLVAYFNQVATAGLSCCACVCLPTAGLTGLAWLIYSSR